MNQSVIGRAATALGLSACFGLLTALAAAQPTSTSPLAPPQNGPRHVNPAQGLVVLTNATVHVKPGVTIDRATLTIRDGKIVSVESQEKPPEGAIPVRDLTGLHVYAGFIEPVLEVEVPRPDINAPGSHWNPRITPQRTALDRGGAGIDRKAAEELRELGFTAAAIVPRGGIFRGTSAVVSLAERSDDPAAVMPRVYKDRVYQGVTFELSREDDGITARRGDDPRWSRYPNSQMGAIALIRQTLSDAAWQQKGRAEGFFAGPRDALDDLFRPQVAARSDAPAADDRPRATLDPEFLLFDVNDELEVLRADAILKEFVRAGAVLGNGMEYRRLEAIKQAGRPMIVPLHEIKTPRVGTIGEQESVSLTELIEWEQTPLNAKRLDDAGLLVALTSAKIPEKAGGRGGFDDRLGNAVRHGLSADRALAMLTTNAASILGVADTLGTVEVGKAANLVIADGPLFMDRPDAPKAGEPGFVRRARIVEVYCDGVRQPVRSRERNDLGGVWNVVLEPGPKAGSNVAITFRIDNAEWPPAITIVKTSTDAQGKTQTARTKAKDLKFEQDAAGDVPSRFSFTFEHEPFGDPGVFTNVGTVGRGDDGALVMRADATRSDGARFRWKAMRTGDLPPEAKTFAWAGTWTIVGPNGPFKPTDPNEPRLVIERGKPGAATPGPDAQPALDVHVRKGDADLATQVTTFDRASDTPALVYTVKGLDANAPDAAQTISLRPAKDNPDRLSGALSADGPEAFQLARVKETPEADALAQVPTLEQLGLPVGPYALVRTDAAQQPRDTVISNATLWTCTDKGVLKDATLVIHEGKIAFIGSSDELGAWFQKGVLIQQPWREVDAKGKHITPGIIDAHSHTGISKGVNESGQAVTAEVRIGDVTDPDSISWYRQLAGGVTTVNNLHGSANPIGGQSQTNKNRWGSIAPNDMHFEGATPGIKFALGENVKQSNWGDQFNTRYPQTRMGVETLIRDRFAAAKEYAQSIADAQGAAFNKNANEVMAGGGGIPTVGTFFTHPTSVRRDLELEALAQILSGARLIHCHSYRQDEILALCRVADEFAFKLGTFQHGLECYKVAEDVKSHSIGASLFSDWWAYKAEVQDAIPHAGPILAEQGVLVSYNSDSDELARRLNVEAGKVVKYSAVAGGTRIVPEEALKFVTLNPAKQLKIDHRVGSLEVGKDADIAIWSGPPLSSLSRCERTFVDGRQLFSLESDTELRKKNQAERARIIQKILGAAKRSSKDTRDGKGGEGKGSSADKPDESSEFVDISIALPEARRAGRRLLLVEMEQRAIDLRREHYLHLLQRGLDPRYYRSGDCGCGEWSFGN